MEDKNDPKLSSIETSDSSVQNNLGTTMDPSTITVEKGEKKEPSSSESVVKIKKTKKYLVGENQERMNYLLQASRYVNSREDAEKFSPAGSSLGSLAMAIGRKCVIRMTPILKRQLCKGCGSALIPSMSSKCRLRRNRQKHMVVTCNKCKTIKRFVTNPDYVLWSDRPEALVE